MLYPLSYEGWRSNAGREAYQYAGIGWDGAGQWAPGIGRPGRGSRGRERGAPAEWQVVSCRWWVDGV